MMKIIILFFSIFFCSSFLQTKTLVLQAQQVTNFDQIMRKAISEWHIITIAQKKNNATPIEKASLINRLHPDFFLMIQLTINPKKTPSCSFYTFAWSATDKWPKQIDSLDFVPFFQAHYVHAKDSYTFACQLHEFFKKRAPSFVQTFYYECPFKPLEGIMCPSLAMELVLPSIEMWNNKESFIIEAVKTMLDSIAIGQNTV